MRRKYLILSLALSGIFVFGCSHSNPKISDRGLKKYDVYDKAMSETNDFMKTFGPKDHKIKDKSDYLKLPSNAWTYEFVQFDGPTYFDVSLKQVDGLKVAVSFADQKMKTFDKMAGMDDEMIQNMQSKGSKTISRAFSVGDVQFQRFYSPIFDEEHGIVFEFGTSPKGRIRFEFRSKNIGKDELISRSDKEVEQFVKANSW